MKLVAVCLLLNTFYTVALADTGGKHDDIDVTSHMPSESRSETASNENAALQLCILAIHTYMRGSAVVYMFW